MSAGNANLPAVTAAESGGAGPPDWTWSGLAADLVPADACDAFRADVARLAGSEDARASDERLAAGAFLVTTLTRLAALPLDQRATYAASAEPVWRLLSPPGAPAAEATIVGASANVLLDPWIGGRPTLPQVRALLAALEDVEFAGGLELAGAGCAALDRLVPRDVRAGYVRAQHARVLRVLGRLDEAMPLSDEAQRLAERARDSWLQGRVALGRVALFGTRGNYPAVRIECAKALRAGERHPEFRHPAHQELARAARAAGDVGSALRHYRLAFATAPNAVLRANTLLALGVLTRELGRHGAALRAFDAVLALDPPERMLPFTRGQRALALAASGDAEAARVEGDRLVALLASAMDPYERVRAEQALGALYRTLGDVAGSRHWYGLACARARQFGFAELRLEAEDALALLPDSNDCAPNDAGLEPRTASSHFAGSAERSHDVWTWSPEPEDDAVVRWLGALPVEAEALLALQ